MLINVNTAIERYKRLSVRANNGRKRDVCENRPATDLLGKSK
jgi:hypothetical protein